MTIKLIVGLGNPGQDYQSHRHNVGFWFCDALAHLYDTKFKKESKFFGEIAKINIAALGLHLLKPSTYMNQCGQSIQSIAKFYQLSVDEILVVHDDLDLAPGAAKIKFGGGHGGHNGLRDTIKALNGSGFYRIRLGIGHPCDKTKVVDFVLNSPSKSEFELIQTAMVNTLNITQQVVEGKVEQAMKTLHTEEKNEA